MEKRALTFINHHKSAVARIGPVPFLTLTLLVYPISKRFDIHGTRASLNAFSAAVHVGSFLYQLFPFITVDVHFFLQRLPGIKHLLITMRLTSW